MTDRPQWIREFGEEYVVPDCITQAEGIRDYSFHAYACPCFDTPLGPDHYLTIWADHPNPAKRRRGSRHRFLITFHNDGPLWGPWDDENGHDTRFSQDLFTTEDETLVLPEYMRLLRIYRQWRNDGQFTEDREVADSGPVFP